MKHNTIKSIKSICTTESYEGESIEQKARRVEESNAPVEAISPLIFTERKKGVMADYNIRTDKWDIAQTAMEKINLGAEEHRKYKQSQPKAEPTNSAVSGIETPQK